MGEDREFFSKEQLAQSFSLERVSANPARFDLKKCTAINADWMRALPADELARRVQQVLVERGVMLDPVSEADALTLAASIPLVQERMETLGQAVGMLGFLFVDEASFAPDPDDAARMLGPDSASVLAAARTALAGLDTWSAADIEAALRSALIEGLGLKPKVAFGSLRVAVTGRRVSPPLFESIELLGRQRTLARIDSAT